MIQHSKFKYAVLRDYNGTKLFEDAAPLLDAEGNTIGTAEGGFAALAQEDTNSDGVVDAQDANWAKLRVWQDKNQDGISQTDELLTMDQAGSHLADLLAQYATTETRAEQLALLDNLTMAWGPYTESGNIQSIAA